MEKGAHGRAVRGKECSWKGCSWKLLDLLVRVRASGRALVLEDLQNLQNVRGVCSECTQVCSHRRNKARREQAVVSRPRGKSVVRTSYIKTTRVLFFWRV